MTGTGIDTPRPLSLPFTRPSPLEPADVVARLREQQPVAAVTASSGEPAWLVTRYQDARSVLTDPRFGITLPSAPAVGEGDGPNDSLFQDPPGHTRLRRLVAAAFTPRRIADLRPRVERLVDELVDQMVARGGEVDLMEALALPLPITVIGELLGVPPDERDRFRSWSDALLSLPTAGPADPGSAWEHVAAQASELVASKSADPGEDLLSALIAVRDSDSGRLSEAELLMMIITLVTAGYVTTSIIAGVGTILLTGHDQWAALHDDPALVPAAIEEVLRFQAVSGEVARVALEDLDLVGTPVRAGEKVVVSLTSANRDERRFAEPDRFDITRRDNAHLTFGHGIHHCLGAGLARVELQGLFGRLAARLPDLGLAVRPDELTWRRSAFFGDEWPEAVPVTW